MTDTPKRSSQGTHGPTFSVSELLTAILDQNRKCLEPPRMPIEPCRTDYDALRSCSPPEPGDEPEARFTFRRPLPLNPIKCFAPEPGEGSDLHLSHCVPINIEHVRGRFVLDLLFDQSWHFRRLLLSNLAATTALAPGETLRLTVSTSQRKFLNRTTLEEVEEAESTEATIVDRDALNVTRSSSRTDNWEVSGNAAVSIPIDVVTLDLGLGGGLSASTTRTTTSTAESVREATQKSAHNLRNLHRLEVVETTETVVENERSRRIVNPYRDRSLLLKIFGLSKEFCVEFALRGIRPAILLEIADMDFNREFVISNGDFLDKYLVDARLRLALPDALAAVLDGTPLAATRELERLSTIALKYLFDEPNVFNVKALGGSDANVPASAFDASASRNGLEDATSNRLGIVFTTLNFFFSVYRNEVATRPRLAIDIALSIEQALGSKWVGIEETEEISNVLDDSQRTEAFRRLGGFLAFVSTTIRPLMKPSQEERDRVQAARQAEFAIARVVDHLRCHRSYYIARYLAYLAEQTHGATLQVFLTAVLSLTADGALNQTLHELFALEAAFVDRNTIVVPGRCRYPPEAAQEFLKQLDHDATVYVPFGVLAVDNVVVACEGMHIEAVAGNCVLQSVSQPDVPAVQIAFGDEPLSVRVLDRSA